MSLCMNPVPNMTSVSQIHVSGSCFIDLIPFAWAALVGIVIFMALVSAMWSARDANGGLDE